MKKQLLRRAALCLTSHIPDEEMRDLLMTAFGDSPALAIPVTRRGVQYLADFEPRRQAFSAALRASVGGCYTVVLVMQFDGLQLRCVMNLAHPHFAKLLSHGLATGLVNVLLGDEGGAQSVMVQLPFHADDVAALLTAANEQVHSSEGRRVADAMLTAAECRQPEALPSMFSDQDVEQAEVSVVLTSMANDSSGDDKESGRSDLSDPLMRGGEGLSRTTSIH